MSKVRNCNHCGKEYLYERKHSKFCSIKCRNDSKGSFPLKEFRYSTLENTLLCILWNCRSRAKRKNLICDIKDSEILELLKKQNGLCAMTGIPMERTNGKRNPYTISIDRIDSYKGYTLDNVHLVCKIFNECKNIYTMDDVKLMCKSFIKYNNINIDE